MYVDLDVRQWVFIASQLTTLFFWNNVYCLMKQAKVFMAFPLSALFVVKYASQYAHDVVLTSIRRRFNAMDVAWASKRLCAYWVTLFSNFCIWRYDSFIIVCFTIYKKRLLFSCLFFYFSCLKLHYLWYYHDVLSISVHSSKKINIL